MLSVNLNFTQPLTMNKIVQFYQFTKHYNGNIYLKNNQRLLLIKSLPKLVSFLLMLSPKEMTLVIDGENVQNAYQSISDIYHSNANMQQATVTQILSPMMKVKI